MGESAFDCICYYKYKLYFHKLGLVGTIGLFLRLSVNSNLLVVGERIAMTIDAQVVEFYIKWFIEENYSLNFV